ncbi:hypothetical protein DEU56DRAFT_221936 [Suillus clintonianus]|uniref:uncharacterized protein n=1 Tax=Suillus clintonianus TaxID=1904413 RepID=UPI001B866E5E|nr:uncharacterized protein DEU56DRAFT_221936 [Suillus clintonianus]KAG2156136.1 hypothetical protein DEU56DRAFT_221936 [Suillus clintonianus]
MDLVSPMTEADSKEVRRRRLLPGLRTWSGSLGQVIYLWHLLIIQCISGFSGVPTECDRLVNFRRAVTLPWPGQRCRECGCSSSITETAGFDNGHITPRPVLYRCCFTDGTREWHRKQDHEHSSIFCGVQNFRVCDCFAVSHSIQGLRTGLESLFYLTPCDILTSG